MTKIQNLKGFDHLKIIYSNIVSSFDIRVSSLLFYLTLLFLPTQLGKHFWPDFSYILGLRVDYLSPTLYLTDALIFLLFVAWATDNFLNHEFRTSLSLRATKGSVAISFGIASSLTLLAMTVDKFRCETRVNIKKSLKIKNFKFQIFVFLMFVVLGILFSNSPLNGWYSLLKLFEMTFFGFYTAWFITNKKILTNVTTVFAVGVLFEAVLSIFQFVNQSSIGGVLYFLGERTFNSQTPGIANASLNGELVLRPYGTFSHPNVLAGYLAIVMTVVISKIKYQKLNIRSILYPLSLMIGSLGLLLTMSRVAIGVWIIILSFYLLRIKRVFLYLIFAVLFLIFITTPLASRFSSLLNLDNESTQERFELNRAAIEMIKSSPVLGVGLGNFLVRVPEYQFSSGFIIQPVHNIFLLIAAETGIIGLGFFLWFLIKTYRRLMIYDLRLKNKKPIIHYSLIINLSSILILGLFDHYFLTLQQGQLILSFIFGLLFSRIRK